MTEAVLGVDAVNDALIDLIGRMSAQQRRKAIRKALVFLRKQSKKRITAQQNSDGSAFAARKQSVNVGKTRVRYVDESGNEKSVVADVSNHRRRGYMTLTLGNGQSFYLPKDRILDKKKVPKRTRKMLTGFRNFMNLKMYGAKFGKLNFKSGAAKLARVHHYGASLSTGGNIPARELLGMPEDDRIAAMNIMIQTLLEDE